eukprot:49977-Eustigmatos_ZCMA.PRE.1
MCACVPVPKYSFSPDLPLRSAELHAGEKVSKEEQQRMWNEAHEWGSTRVAETISELKGFYVKS